LLPVPISLSFYLTQPFLPPPHPHWPLIPLIAQYHSPLSPVRSWLGHCPLPALPKACENNLEVN
jgi:hypothetical protein